MESQNKEDQAKEILEKANFWISNVDTKVSFVIGLTGVLIGFIFASDSITSSIQGYIKTVSNVNLEELKVIFSLIAVILFLTTLFYISKTIYFLLKALKGRIDPKHYQQPGLETNSSIFWGSIASTDFITFKNSFDKTKEELLIDLQSQAYINSLITKEKFVNYNNGLRSLKISLLTFILFKLLTYLPI